MQELANTLIDSGAQCWACPIFDDLFAIISNAAAAAYERLTVISVILFSILFAFYILNAVWQNIKSDKGDPFFMKSLKPILLNSLLVLSLLVSGLTVPKFISKITFEPVAEVTLAFSKTMLPSDYVIPDDYEKIQLDDSGFFNPNLRDTIIQILQTSVANFQVYIKIGVAIIDSVFSFPKTISFGFLMKRLLVFFVGLFLTYNFARLFIKYSFCFMDIIVAMAMFAFFFPLSLVFFIFKKSDGPIPDWMKKVGDGLSSKQIKTLINAIASVASAILTYTIIMILIRGYLVGNGVDMDSVKNTSESLLDFDLDNPNAIQITFFGSIVLVFIINYIAKQIPNITKEILSAFKISQENSLSNEMGDNVLKLTNIMANQVKNVVKNVVTKDKEKTPAKDTKDTKGTDSKK